MVLSFVRVDRKTVRQLNSPWRTGRGSWKKLGRIHGKTTCLRFWIKIHMVRTSLVAQWIRTLLSMQGTWFDSCSRKTPHVKEQLEPTCHDYWSLPVLGLMSHNYRAHMLHLLKPPCPEPLLHNKIVLSIVWKLGCVQLHSFSGLWCLIANHALHLFLNVGNRMQEGHVYTTHGNVHCLQITFFPSNSQNQIFLLPLNRTLVLEQ